MIQENANNVIQVMDFFKITVFNQIAIVEGIVLEEIVQNAIQDIYCFKKNAKF